MFQRGETIYENLFFQIRDKTRQSVDLQAQFHAKEELLLEQHQRRIDAIERLLHQLRLVQRDLELNSRKTVTLDLKSPAASASALHDRSSSACTTTGPGTPEDYGFNQLKPAQKKKSGILKTSSSSLGGGGGGGGGKKERFTFSSAAAASASSSRKGSLRLGLEELETANCHLRRMVDSLFVELEHCQRENSQLRGRVRIFVLFAAPAAATLLLLFL